MSLRPKVERREGAIPDTTARAIAARLEKAAARARERGLDLDAVADMQGEALALLAALYPEEARLLSRDGERTLFDDMAHAQAIEARRPGRPTKTRHPFPTALAAKGLTVAEWARTHKVEREVVKSWFAPGTAGRRIPLHWAKVIQRELGVTATEDVWRNGIR